MNEEPNILMKPDEVAALLRISLRQVNRLKAAGTLPFVRIGPKTIRYYRHDVEKIVEEGLPDAR